MSTSVTFPAKKPAIVYVAVNMKNKKFYIGVTCRPLKKRQYCHHYAAFVAKVETAFARALRKYGSANFLWFVWASFSTSKEALAEEKRLIFAFSPAYNSTKGGQGFHPRVWTAAMKEKIAAIHRGNTYRLGIPHTEETRHRLRMFGLRDKKKWLARSHLGPMSQARRVVCLNDRKSYESVSAAARAYGLDTNTVLYVCQRKPSRYTASGLVFRFEGEHKNPRKQIKEATDAVAAGRNRSKAANYRKRIPVICLDDGLVFPSALQAALHYGFTPVTRYAIGEVCRGKTRRGKTSRRVHGRRFAYADKDTTRDVQAASKIC